MKKSIEVELPIYWQIRKKDANKRLLSYNLYSSQHHFSKNSIKQNYQNMIIEKLENIKCKQITKKFKIHYIYYYKNQRSDGMNVVSIISKFFLDSLQEILIIEDDSVNHCIGESWECCEDKDNPRIKIKLMEIE